MVTQLSVGITTYLFNLVTFSYAGADGVAAISVILYAEMLLTAILMGFANGVAPVFSYQFGAKGYAELLRLLRLSLGIIFLFGILSFAAANIFAVPLMTLFLPDGGRAYALALGGFGLFSWSFLLCGFNLFSSTFFTALSDGRMSAILSFVRNLVGIVVFLLLLPRLNPLANFGSIPCLISTVASNATPALVCPDLSKLALSPNSHSWSCQLRFFQYLNLKFRCCDRGINPKISDSQGVITVCGYIGLMKFSQSYFFSSFPIRSMTGLA